MFTTCPCAHGARAPASPPHPPSPSRQARRGFSPVAVHTTFQFCDTAEFAWGKRSRLRERLMWLVDPDTYYERVGPASEPKPEPTELGYAGFLHLDGEARHLSQIPCSHNRPSTGGKAFFNRPAAGGCSASKSCRPAVFRLRTRLRAADACRARR